jgi:hypothetical protein
MERQAAELLRDALALPPEARAEEAWRREIEVRLEQIDSGAVKLISWRDARQCLRGRLDG